MRPAVLLRLHFTLHAVDVMSRHKPAVVLIDVTCQIVCVEVILTVNFKQYVSFSVGME